MSDPELIKSLRNKETVELVVYGSRAPRCFRTDAFIEDGRPHALSSISLATWSLLSSHIKDYRNGVLSYVRRLICFPVVLFYIAFIVNASFLPEVDNIDELYMTFMIQIILVILLILSIFVVRWRVGTHLQEEFHPAVIQVVDELRPSIVEAGFDVEYIVLPGWRNRSVLRFHRRDPEV